MHTQCTLCSQSSWHSPDRTEQPLSHPKCRFLGDFVRLQLRLSPVNLEKVLQLFCLQVYSTPSTYTKLGYIIWSICWKWNKYIYRGVLWLFLLILLHKIKESTKAREHSLKIFYMLPSLMNFPIAWFKNKQKNIAVEMSQ